MKNLVYRGPHKKREFWRPGGSRVIFSVGVPQAVDDDFADYLLQDHGGLMQFELVTKPSKTKEEK